MKRPIRLAVVVLGIGSVLVIGTTAAAFTQTLQADGSLSGSVAVAQGTDPADRYGDPAQPNIVAEVTPDSRGIATLYDDQHAYPTRPTASFTVQAALLEGSAPADLRAMLSAPEGETAWIAPYLRFGIEVDGVNQDPDGIPRSMQQVNDANGILIGTREAGAPASQILIKVWLAPDTPQAAYGQQLPVDVTIIGETTAGTTFELEVTLQ